MTYEIDLTKFSFSREGDFITATNGPVVVVWRVVGAKLVYNERRSNVTCSWAEYVSLKEKADSWLVNELAKEIQKAGIEYPIKIKVSRKFLDELYNCEFGRYEDARCAREAGDEELIKENNYELVFCDFGERWKTQIEIRNDAELCETYYAAASGTIGLYHCNAANTLLDKIRPYVRKVDPDLVKRWPHQSGW